MSDGSGVSSELNEREILVSDPQISEVSWSLNFVWLVPEDFFLPLLEKGILSD